MSMKQLWALMRDLYYMHGFDSVTIDVNNGEVTIMGTTTLDYLNEKADFLESNALKS